MTLTDATAPFQWVRIDIAHESDWRDALPQLFEADGEPVDLTAATLTLLVCMHRYKGEDQELLEFSTASGEIQIVDAKRGLATFALPKDSVNALNIGTGDHMLVLAQESKRREIWRGPLIVHLGTSSIQLTAEGEQAQ